MEDIKKASGKRKVATIGTFDGLHRGHQRVISTVINESEERGMDPLVISFDRHPLETIAPQRAPGLIQSPEERSRMLEEKGVDLLTLEFTPEFASLTAEQLLVKIHEEEDVDVLIVGYDNTFGCDGRSMNISDYKNLGWITGVEVIEAPYEPKAGSSAIRHLLKEGNLTEANQLLGRNFTIGGIVKTGKKIGHSIGFPTANVVTSYRALLPKNGAYVADVIMPDAQRMRGVVNIGHQPTVAQDAPVRLEVHIPGFSGDLYDKKLSIEFLSRLRDEKKFDSVEELKSRIKEDVRQSLGWRSET